MKKVEFEDLHKGVNELNELRSLLIQNRWLEIEINNATLNNLRILYQDLCIQYFEVHQSNFPLDALGPYFVDEYERIKGIIKHLYSDRLNELIDIETEINEYYMNSNQEL